MLSYGPDSLYDNFCRSKRKHFHFLIRQKVKHNGSVGFCRLKNKNYSLSVKCINPYLSDTFLRKNSKLPPSSHVFQHLHNDATSKQLARVFI